MSRQYSCLCQGCAWRVTRSDGESYLRCQGCQTLQLRTELRAKYLTRRQAGWRVKQTLSSGLGRCRLSDNPRSPQYQIVFRYRVRVSGYNAMSETLPGQHPVSCLQWVWETQPWLQIELLISVHITYYILQPPPLYCHRYWTHAWTNMWPLWPFSRGFMSVLYALSVDVIVS